MDEKEFGLEQALSNYFSAKVDFRDFF